MKMKNSNILEFICGDKFSGHRVEGVGVLAARGKFARVRLQNGGARKKSL